MSKDIKAFIDIVNDSVLRAGNITEQEMNELGIRGAGSISFAAVQQKLQDAMNNNVKINNAIRVFLTIF